MILPDDEAIECLTDVKVVANDLIGISVMLDIYCKAWTIHNGGRFPKTAFSLDWEQGVITCPNRVSIPFEVNKTVRFPKSTCAECPLRDNCTTSTT